METFRLPLPTIGIASEVFVVAGERVAVAGGVIFLGVWASGGEFPGEDGDGQLGFGWVDQVDQSPGDGSAVAVGGQGGEEVGESLGESC